jgi:hypothetical protein
VHRPCRKVKVTERRAAEDYAQCMRKLVDVHYPGAACIRVVQDNLSTHSAGALYQAFAPAEARRIPRRLEFHYTPKLPAGSTWSIEIGVLRSMSGSQNQRPKTPHQRNRRLGATTKRRRARIKRMFTTEKARSKMGRAYPVTAKESSSLCRATRASILLAPTSLSSYLKILLHQRSKKTLRQGHLKPA